MPKVLVRSCRDRPGKPALIEDPVFYAVAVPALLLVGISKGGFGGGVGLIGVPLLALAVPLVQAAAIMLPILCLMDLFALRAYWGTYSGANVRVLMPACMLGVAAGAWAFGSLDERWIRGLVGTLAVGFTAQYAISRLRNRHREPRAPRPVAGWFWGTATGFTSTIAHAGGPPMSIYLLPQRLSPMLYVGTTVLLFSALNYVKLIPYAWLDQLHGGNLLTSLVLAPLAPVGVALGRWLHVRIDVELFYRLAYAMLLFVGLRLMWDGWVSR